MNRLIVGLLDIQLVHRGRITLMVVIRHRCAGGLILGVVLPVARIPGDQRLQFVTQRIHPELYESAGVRIRYRLPLHGIMFWRGIGLFRSDRPLRHPAVARHATPCHHTDAACGDQRHSHGSRHDGDRCPPHARRCVLRRTGPGGTGPGSPVAVRIRSAPPSRHWSVPSNIVSQTVANICEVRSAACSWPMPSVMTATPTLERPSEITTK